MRLHRQWYSLRLRIRSLLRRDRVERDLDDEIRDHLETEIEAGMARGMTAEEARRAAVRGFGGVEQRKEECRDVRRTNVVEHRIADARFAIRQLFRYRGFSSAAVAVPALGIAACVALFGFVDAAMIRPLPYAEPSRLVTVFGTTAELAATQKRGQVSYLDFRDWRARNPAFSAIAAFDVRAGFLLDTVTGPERVPGLRVSSGFFRTLGVTPLMGREFSEDEEGAAAPPTAMISYAAWQGRFGGSADVLGRTVTLRSSWLRGAEPHVIIGILPADFHFPMAEHAEFWATVRGPQACWDVRSCRSMEAVARLAGDGTVQAASAAMTSTLEQLRQEYPDHHRTPEVASVQPLRDVMLGDVGRVLSMLLGGTLLLLVIACTNVASLVLARTESRSREIAIRGALGASTGRLVLQFATEGFVLAGMAATFGVLLASFGMSFLRSLLTADMIARMPYLDSVGFNTRVTGFAVFVAVVVGLVFAVTPLVRVAGSRAMPALKDDNRTTGGRTWRRLGAHLVVAELAVAVVLLVGAGLLGRSLYRLINVDVGFSTERLASVSVVPELERTAAMDRAHDENKARAAGIARQIADRVAAVPGVESVGYADIVPLSASLAPSSTFWVLGRPKDAQRLEGGPVRRVSAGYFTTLQARLLRGRYFLEEEVAAARPVVIINQTAAQRFFPGIDPVGHAIAFGGPESPRREIVGVVADIKDGPPETKPMPSAYVPFDQSSIALVVRVAQSEATLFPAIRSAIRGVRPEALVGSPTTMVERANRLPSTSQHRSTAWLIGAFATLAFVLSVVGLYGVVAYSVGLRTREIGVRIALGAQRRAVYRQVLGEAVRLAALGIVLGVVGAVTTATLMRSLLFDVLSWDPLTLVSASGILMLAAILASYIPARRAASVNPIEVLGSE